MNSIIVAENKESKATENKSHRFPFETTLTKC